MLRPTNLITGGCLFVLAALSSPVAAADDAEFAFNLLSDIAPILALFGDQFAKQFTSESLSWVDHLIFAMVPLGIISAITGAIRVQGMQVAKAFIGRSRENRALAEIELMSSTSGEVCELFNGNSIVRAMGKPRIGQILIFPGKYDNLEEAYKASDEALMNSEPKAVEKGTKSKELQDKSMHSTPDEESAPIISSQPSLPANAPKAETPLSGPPNLQLNLSSDHFDQRRLKKRHEIILAAFAAVILQISLIAIAAVTTYYLSPRFPSFLESKVYGFPCYAAGSILLSIGTGLCSLIVEHSTIEHSLEVANSDVRKAPRLMWIQRYQTVNDQSFKSYAILAGPKRRVIISRRDDDVEKQDPRDAANPKRHDDRVSRSDIDSTSSHSSSSKDRKKEGLWEWLTVGAALSAGIGFTAQFMGLRGLAFPCSIAQLGAILIMALIRASIRRRLGRVPTHCRALDGYELDFLATQIVFYPEIREFHTGRTEEMKDRNCVLPSGSCVWKVITQNPGESHAQFVRSSQNKPKRITPETTEPSNTAPLKQLTSKDLSPAPQDAGPTLRFKASSSQQLLRVRERLGNLCNFPSKSTQSALCVAQCVELLLESFFPSLSSSPAGKLEQKGKESSPSFSWLIEVTRLCTSGTSEDLDTIEIPIVRKESEHSTKWEADIGKIEATLSLWMASIEAKRFGDRSPASSDPPLDWRRTKAGDDLRYSFGRIIGDNLNDDVLKRDVSWWVDSLVAEQSDITTDGGRRGYDNSDDEESGDEESEDVESNDGKISLESDEPTRKKSKARGENVDIVIGFNGFEPPKDKTAARELGMVSKASLSTILAQHLFTSFMWTISESLPRNCLDSGPDGVKQEVEIEGPQTFDSIDFAETWLRPRLRHRKLTKIIRSMESYGLGSTTDILLCMIPALSAKNLLPDQAILRLMPRVGPGRGWVETATCYNKLLTMIKTEHKDKKLNEDDKLSVAVAVATIDFLSSAYETYDEQMEPPSDLYPELEVIEKQIRSPKFTTIMKKLEPVYRRQDRHEIFSQILDKKSSELQDLDRNFANNTLGFTRHHLAIFAADNDSVYQISRQMSEDGQLSRVRDIFGWTPYHYGSLANDEAFNIFMFTRHSVWTDHLPWLLDNLGRSPVHIAALSGKSGSLASMLRVLSHGGRKSVVQAGGFDGMTPLHLVSKTGRLKCLEVLNEHGGEQPFEKKDSRGRQPLHIASRLGCTKIITQLLNMGSRSNELDEAGKCPIDHFVEYATRKRGENVSQTQQSIGSLNASVSMLNILNEDSFNMLLKFAMDSSCRYSSGKSILHFAVEFADDNSIRRLLLGKRFDIEAQDKDGRTPLHYAILRGRNEVFRMFLDEFQANPSAKDSHDITALMFAAQQGLIEVAKALLDRPKAVALVDTDYNNRTTIHYARGREMVELLVSKGCNLLATDSEGRTALHRAIERGDRDIALYLLKPDIPGQVQENAFDDNRESLLVTACKQGFSEIVPEILKHWPATINAKDSRQQQPPISWACVNEHHDIIEQLLQHQGTEVVDVNQPAPGWRGYTPIHFAAGAEDPKALTLLLKQSSAEIHQESTTGETPLDRALVNGRLKAARLLLLNEQTSDAQRLHRLKEFTSSRSPKFHVLIRDILQILLGTNLICEYFRDLYDQEIPASAQKEIDRFVVDLKRGTWVKLKTPYHIAILLRDKELAQTFKDHNVDQDGLDEDNWSSIDYLERFCLEENFRSLFDHLEPVDINRPPDYMKPTALICTQYKESLQVTPEPAESHGNYPTVHVIKVIKDSPNLRRGCIHANHSIPPSEEYFHFEIEVLRNSNSGILGIGFCGPSRPNYSYGAMPGWFKGSWAYHGDDGKLFVESGYGFSPSPDFGGAGTFEYPDVVGVCLHLKTGQGFCTRNGEKIQPQRVSAKRRATLFRSLPLKERKCRLLNIADGYSGDILDPFLYLQVYTESSNPRAFPFSLRNCRPSTTSPFTKIGDFKALSIDSLQEQGALKAFGHPIVYESTSVQASPVLP
ncbi:hypothetical protein CFIO01_07406 [Colletotrichum fioriniae PJ7]|uniref:B30.2/SPRY domain-containing protein n=1 Tax=Colletotrichum fioriniae PJ7 TaxID=1445577 RepID=A0A010RNS1_9PEZI|nr:hypothetical protein CFIO01_07406 [Colletotrichum fioriniae PJ7]